MMGWYGGWGAGWLGMGLMTLLWVALIGVVVWAVVRVAAGSGGGPSTTGAAPTPRAVLDHRLAAGEIDVEEYARLRRLLEGQSVGTGSVTREPEQRP